MRRTVSKLIAAAVLAAAVATPAMSKVVRSTLPPPPNGTLIGGCDSTLPGPNASACAGYYTGNILNGSSTDILNQQNAIASLPGTFTWDGNWTGLENSTTPDLVITALTNGNQLNFNTMMFGLTIIGAHFGNIQDNIGGSGNVSVFWLFDFGTDRCQLHHARQYARFLERRSVHDGRNPAGSGTGNLGDDAPRLCRRRHGSPPQPAQDGQAGAARLSQ